MSDEPRDYAPEYTRAERLRAFLPLLALALAALALLHLWLLPAWRAFVEDAPCRTLWGVDGVTVVWHGAFVGLPLLAGLLTAAFFLPRGLRILRDGQLPPRGEKVFRRTPYVRGPRARVMGWMHALACLPFLGLALWGLPQARALSARTAPAAVECPAVPAPAVR